jgi:putative ABC transport system substrate-binding protein
MIGIMNDEPAEDVVPRIIILTLILLTVLIPFGGRAEAGREIVVVQSFRANPYEDAFKGFQADGHADVTRIILSESKGENELKHLHAAKPDLVLAIGMDALARVRDLKDIPIVYVMVLNPVGVLSEGKRITGVNMTISPERQLAILLEALPKTKTIGLLYDPDRTGQMAKRVRTAAEMSGISLLAGEVHRSKEVPASILKMKGEIDIFWMLPDLTVVTPETVDFLLLFALEDHTPILTFSDKYVALGALLSVGVDPFDMGRQAGEMVDRILSGVDVSTIPRAEARKVMVTVNLKIAKKMGITISEKTLKMAKTID